MVVYGIGCCVGCIVKGAAVNLPRSPRGAVARRMGANHTLYLSRIPYLVRWTPEPQSSSFKRISPTQPYLVRIHSPRTAFLSKTPSTMNESDLTAERHPTLYFPNGDIVLSASIDSAPPRTQLFCVHKVLLTHHSTAFANLFADANPGSGESCDGVPMVELHGDKAEDLALLLNYLYNPT